MPALPLGIGFFHATASFAVGAMAALVVALRVAPKS
jgi:hypothetical protein